MSMTSTQRVEKCLELLKAGLVPFLEREFDRFNSETVGTDTYMKDPRQKTTGQPFGEWDAGGLLRLTWEGWGYVFRRTLGQEHRDLARELWKARIRVLEEQPPSDSETHRVLEGAAQLLAAVAAPGAAEVRRMLAPSSPDTH